MAGECFIDCGGVSGETIGSFSGFADAEASDPHSSNQVGSIQSETQRPC